MNPTLGRLTLVGAVLIAAAIAIPACVDAPVQPGAPHKLSETGPSFSSSTTLVCENLVYPVSLCYPFQTPSGAPGQRELLCTALRKGTGASPLPPPFQHPVSGKPATETFKLTYASDGKTVTGSRETVTIPRPYPYPPQILYFTITRAQIESDGMCLGVVT